LFVDRIRAEHAAVARTFNITALYDLNERVKVNLKVIQGHSLAAPVSHRTQTRAWTDRETDRETVDSSAI